MVENEAENNTIGARAHAAATLFHQQPNDVQEAYALKAQAKGEPDQDGCFQYVRNIFFPSPTHHSLQRPTKLHRNQEGGAVIVNSFLSNLIGIQDGQLGKCCFHVNMSYRQKDGHLVHEE